MYTKKHLPFWLENFFNKITKPQITTKVEFFINDKSKLKFFGKSLTANFLQELYANYNKNSADWVVSPQYGSKTSAKTHGGGLTSFESTTPQLWISAGGEWRGISFGSGTQPILPDVYKLQTMINNGTGAGQLLYMQQQGIVGVTVTGSNSKFVIQKLATNSSGGTITITEVGIYSNGSALVDQNYVLIFYDTGFNLPVLNTETVTCQITFEITT